MKYLVIFLFILCSCSSSVSEERPVLLIDSGIQDVPVDSGTDSGSDVGTDSGSDAGTDAGTDSRTRDCVQGYIVTGQSLGAGSRVDQIPRSPVTVNTDPNKMMFSGLQSPSGSLSPSDSWKISPVTNPMRSIVTASGYPSNVWDESISTSFAKNIPGRSFHINVAIGGAPIFTLIPSDPNNQHSFAGIVGEVTEAMKRFDCFEVNAVLMVHGESDNGSRTYKADVENYRNLVNSAVKGITNQSSDIDFYLTQPSSRYPTGSTSFNSTNQDILDLASNSHFYLVGPKYGLEYDGDDFHLTPVGTDTLGKMYSDSVLRKNAGLPTSTYPVSFLRVGNHFTVTYSTDVVIDTSLGNPHSDTQYWNQSLGYEAQSGYGLRLPISNVKVSGKKVELDVSSPVSEPVYLSYATYLTGKERFGQIRGVTWSSQFLKKL